MSSKNNLTTSKQFSLFLLLAAGGALFYFSNGIHANAVAAWLAPIFLMRFSRQSRPANAFMAIAIVVGFASFFMFQGMFPIPPDAYIGLTLVTAVFMGVSYLIDRLVSPRLPRFWASLVFPSIVTSGLYLSTLSNPFGTWGNDSYVQIGFFPLVQVASLVGLWGVFFLLCWFAAGVNDAIETGWKTWRRSKAPWVIAGITTATLLLAGARLLVPQTELRDPPRIAVLTNTSAVTDKFFSGCETRDDYACRSKASAARHDILFSHSRDAAENGAKIVVWYESAAQYDAPNENAFMARAQAFAKAQEIYLVFGAVKVPSDPDALLVNKAVIVTPTGQIAGEYLKAHPVPGEPIVKGTDDILTHDTPYGRLGIIICFDADFTQTSIRAAKAMVDILIIPSNDWREIASVHADMAVYRGLESGAWIVRATSNGVSLIADPLGRVLAQNNSFRSEEPYLQGAVTSSRSTTVYPTIGNLFAQLNVILALSLCIWRLLPFAAPRRKSSL